MSNKKTWIKRWGDDAIGFWLNVALAVFLVWRAGQVHDDRDSVFYLFAATFVLIHAHGFRILAEIKKGKTNVAN